MKVKNAGEHLGCLTGKLGTCTHGPVIKRLVRCQFMGDEEDCVMCRTCDLHFHVPKGSRPLINENPMPWTPPKARE